jgi:hypothetical protein
VKKLSAELKEYVNLLKIVKENVSTNASTYMDVKFGFSEKA